MGVGLPHRLYATGTLPVGNLVTLTGGTPGTPGTAS